MFRGGRVYLATLIVAVGALFLSGVGLALAYRSTPVQLRKRVTEAEETVTQVASQWMTVRQEIENTLSAIEEQADVTERRRKRAEVAERRSRDREQGQAAADPWSAFRARGFRPD